jgi:hypothetical protein
VPHEKVNGQAQGGMCAFPLPPFPPRAIKRGLFSSLTQKIDKWIKSDIDDFNDVK